VAPLRLTEVTELQGLSFTAALWRLTEGESVRYTSATRLIPKNGAGKMRRRLFAGALAIATLAAMPMQDALGAKPVRETHRGTFSDIIPAGLGCSFAVKVEAEFRGSGWQFSDGRQVANNNASQILTNIETGTPYVHRSDYHLTDRISADGTLLEVIDGRFLAQFYPGDQGPEGEVGPDGALYGLIGHHWLTYDPEADVITSFELRGRAVDICQILAG
jgi:hypothetical protein